ncbi:nucleotide exchange factor GrpE [Legionella sp. CNM-4043-24]|uniref:nucleotide exchange factor GrpE n=1 Tax=Legionella sp. CNM-4043-24 TaxID=3421646 RepID=UPI00403AF42C
MSKESKKDWKQFKESNDHDTEFDGGEAEEHAASGALSHPAYAELEEKLTLAEQKAHENWEKSVRAVAELDNVRRRTERDIANAHRYGLEKIVSSLIPVADSLEQALQLAKNEDDSAMAEGLQLTFQLFLDALQKHGVTRIDPQGEAFNPQEHEAMSTQEVADVAPNTVVVVFQKGYKLSDRVVRPARVIVSKSPQA